MSIQERYDDVIIGQVKSEMQRQIDKWGVQEHEPLVWNAILGEEVGEVSKAILETWFQGGDVDDDGYQYRKELIHVAAVAISAIRALDMSRDLSKKNEGMKQAEWGYFVREFPASDMSPILMTQWGSQEEALRDMRSTVNGYRNGVSIRYEVTEMLPDEPDVFLIKGGLETWQHYVAPINPEPAGT